MPTTPLTFDLDQVRSIRLASQGLASAPGQPVTTVVARSGWVRTLGGCDAYLAIRARQRTLRRAELDTAIDRSDLQVVPAARGCMYLVPRADVPLCLRFAEQMSATRAQREHAKAGIHAGEVEQVAELAVAALKKSGPMTTDALRKAMPQGAVRSLGERGKKVGISSPLPAALRRLEFEGRIERTPEGGRVDTERYLWRSIARSPFANCKLPDEPAKLHALLLERYVAHAGVATLAAFCTWSGLSQRDAKAALPHADLVLARITGRDGDVLTTTEAPALLRMQGAVEHAAAFLPFEDNLVHLYGGPAHLVDEPFLDLQLPKWNDAGRSTRLGDARYLSLRGLIADGRLCGFWEYDPDARLAVPRCFQKPSKAAQQMIEELSASVTGFLRDEVGHGHSFSLDSDDELRKRLRQLRAIGGDKVVVAARARARTKAPSVAKVADKLGHPPKAGTGKGRAANGPARHGKTVKTVKVPRPARPRARGKK